jgi:hypothetical protein
MGALVNALFWAPHADSGAARWSLQSALLIQQVTPDCQQGHII